MEGYEIMVIALITSIVLVVGSHFIGGKQSYKNNEKQA
jgi:Tfp pilus assembly protein PilW